MLEAAVIKKVREFKAQSRDDNAGWRQRVRLAKRMYLGNQWDQEDLEILRRQGRPALTNNRIMPVVNALSGSQRQNRQDFKVFPKKGGLGPVAEILTALIKHTMATNHADWVVSSWFLDGLITGKGWIGFDVDYANDPANGDLKIMTFDPLSVYEDRSGDGYDLNDGGKFVCVCRWEDRKKLELEFPGKVSEIGGWNDEDEGETTGRRSEDYDGDDAELETISRTNKTRCHVMETWWKEWQKITYLVDRQGLEFRRVTSKNKPIATALATTQPDRFVTVDRVGPVLHVARTLGEVVLEHIEDPFNGLVMFPYIRYCPFYLSDPNGGGNIMGVVDNLVSPQQEHNKRRSQALHHLNTTANSGWMYEENTLSPDMEEALEVSGSRPGINIKYRKSPPQRLNPAPISAGHINAAELAASDIKEISGVNADLMGNTPEKNTSGVSMDYRIRQGLTVNEVVFDNFEWSQQIFGLTLMNLIRAGTGDQKSLLYSDDEIRAVIEKENLNVNLDEVRSFRTGRYGVEIAQNPNMPTIRMANFRMIQEIAKQFPVNPKFILEASDIPNKDAIIADLEAKMGGGPNTQGPPAAGVPQIPAMAGQ